MIKKMAKTKTICNAAPMCSWFSSQELTSTTKTTASIDLRSRISTACLLNFCPSSIIIFPCILIIIWLISPGNSTLMRVGTDGSSLPRHPAVLPRGFFSIFINLVCFVPRDRGCLEKNILLQIAAPDRCTRRSRLC